MKTEQKGNMYSKTVRRIKGALCMLLCLILMMPVMTAQAATALSRYSDEDYIGYFNEGLAPVICGGRWGFIDQNGREVIKPQYDGISNPKFVDGLALVGKAGKYGYIDKNGKEVIKLQYDSCSSPGHFSEGLAGLGKGGKYIFVNKKGKEVLKVNYDSASEFTEGMSQVSKKGKYGYINKDRKSVV